MKRMILGFIGTIIEAIDFQSTVNAWFAWEKDQTYPEPDLVVPMITLTIVLIVCFVLFITGCAN